MTIEMLSTRMAQLKCLQSTDAALSVTHYAPPICSTNAASDDVIVDFVYVVQYPSILPRLFLVMMS